MTHDNITDIYTKIDKWFPDFTVVADYDDTKLN
jgi:hypothetical protein